MREGLIWRSAPFLSQADNDKRWYRLAEVCGVLTDDPRPVAAKKDQSIIGYTLCLKYGTKKFLKAAVWKEKYNFEEDYTLVNIAQTLEQHERIVVWGVVVYTPKDVIRGEVIEARNEMFRKREFDDESVSQNWFFQLDVYYISPTPEDVLFIKQLRSSPAIQNLLNSDASDAMESVNDHADEYDDAYSDDMYEDDDYEVTI